MVSAPFILIPYVHIPWRQIELALLLTLYVGLSTHTTHPARSRLGWAERHILTVLVVTCGSGAFDFGHSRAFYTKPTNGTEPNINPLYQDLSCCHTPHHTIHTPIEKHIYTNTKHTALSDIASRPVCPEINIDITDFTHTHTHTIAHIPNGFGFLWLAEKRTANTPSAY